MVTGKSCVLKTRPLRSSPAPRSGDWPGPLLSCRLPASPSPASLPKAAADRLPVPLARRRTLPTSCGAQRRDRRSAPATRGSASPPRRDRSRSQSPGSAVPSRRQAAGQVPRDLVRSVRVRRRVLPRIGVWVEAVTPGPPGVSGSRLVKVPLPGSSERAWR